MADEEVALAPPPPAPGPQPTEEELAYRTPHAAPFTPQIYKVTEPEALTGYPEQRKPEYVERNDAVPSRPYVAPTGGEPTPIARELGEPQPAPVPAPSALPDWDDIVQTPTYQGADTPGRLEMLDNYVAQARSFGHQLAAKNKEDPALYDAHLDKFYSREKAALETPFSIFDNTVRAGAKGAAEKTAELGAGGVGLAKHILQPELDLSYIKNLSLDEARHERDLTSEQLPTVNRQSEEAQEYLKHPLAGLQDPSKQFEGGRAAAFDAIQRKSGYDRTLSALNTYIESDGREVPRQTATEAAYAGVKQLPEMADKAIQVDDLYIREHPKLYNATKTIGSFVPWIFGQALAVPLGPEAEIGMNALMSFSDAFQTGMESGRAKIDQRLKAGEQISQYDQEKMILDDASMTAFGVGSFNTVAASIFSEGMQGFHVPEGEISFQTFKNKLQNFMLHPEETIHPIAAEVGGQAAIQAGSQFAANVAAKASGVSPEQPLTEGIPEAALGGAELGAGGALMRGVASGFRWGVDNYKIDRFSDRARTLSDKLFDTGHPDLTREKSLDVAIATSVPTNYQDAVRSRIALTESAKDQAQVSQELKETSPETATEMQKQADATANTDVSATTRMDAQEKTVREQIAQKKAREAAEKAAKEAAEKKPPTEEEVPPPAPTVEGAPAPTPPAPTVEEAPPPTPPAPTRISPDDLNAKVDQLLGPDATPEAKKQLADNYLNDFAYQDFRHDKGASNRRTTAYQLMHDLGLAPRAGAPFRSWAGHTPGMLAEVDNHFSQFLDQRIAEKTAKEAVPPPPPTEPVAPVVEAPPAVEAPPPVALIPPEVFQDAVQTNNPAELLRQLKQGKTFAINQDQLEQYDDFLGQHKIEATFDKASGNYFLGIGIPSLKELTVKPKGRPEAETDTVELSKNSPELLEKIQALPPHPDEENLLKKAYAYLDREHDYIAGQVNPKYASVEDVTSATIASYLKDLREDPDHPPAISVHLKGVLGDYHKKVSAQKRVKLVSSTQPIAEGAAETIETQAAAEEREKEAEPEAMAKGEVHPTFGLGYADWQTIVEKIADTFTTSPEKRAVWQYFDKLTGGNIDRPEEYGTATGIPKEVTAAVEKKIHEWLKQNLAELAPRGEAPTAPVGGPGRPGAGAAGQRPTPGEPAVPPPTHEGAVPRPTGEAGAGVRPPPPPPGGREPGVPERGGAAAERPPEPVPPARESETGAIIPPAAAGGERAELASRAVPPEPAPGEPRATAIEFRERAERERAEPGGVAEPKPAGEGGAAAPGREPAGGVTLDSGKVATPESVGDVGIEKERGRRVEEEGVTVLAGGEVQGRKANPADRRYTFYDGKGNKYTGLTWTEVNDLSEKLKTPAKPAIKPEEVATGMTAEQARRKLAEFFGGADNVDFGHLNALQMLIADHGFTPEQALAEVTKTKLSGKGYIRPEDYRSTTQIVDDALKARESGTPARLPAAEPVTYSALDVAKAMMKKPSIAEEHDIALEEFDNAQDLADHIEGMEADQEDPEAWYRELYRDLRLKLPEEKPVAPAAVTPKPETPAATALKAQPSPKRSALEDRGLEMRIGRGAQTLAESLWNNKESAAWQDMGLDPKDFSSLNDLVVRVGDMFRGITKQQTFAEANKTILDFTSRIGKTAAVLPEERIATASGQEVAQKIFKHFSDNPEAASKYQMEGVESPEHIITLLQGNFPDASPERINQLLQGIAQKEGIVEPPRPPGGADSSGVMHSLVPGVTSATQKFSQIGDLISHLRMSSDPAMQAFAKSLNAYRDKVGNLNVRQLNNVTPAIFYHDGELWVSPAALEHEHGLMALAHEVQHSIAQEKIINPKTPQDFEAAAHWEALRDELRKNLPAELRDALEGHLAQVFNEYDGLQELNTRTLTHDEKNWLPVLYAAHSGENMLHAAFSNRMFRDHLASIRYPRGETLLSKVHDWGRTIFGEQAFKYADEAHPLVSERPGIPAQFNPKVFDLRDSYPLTESEHQVRRTVAKYQLHHGLDAALRQVEALSNDPRHKAIAQMLREIVAKYPEIKIGLENRLGGIAGGYDFQGDRVTVNPHMDDHSIESTILHEVVHSLTMAKIDAFEKGQVHLLSAEDAHAVADLEELRKAALADRRVPQVIRDIAELPTYEQREKALLDLFQRHPEMEKWYGLTDTREFASEALTNGGLQDHLNRVPAPTEEGGRPKTMLQKMFSWVRKFLGFKDNTILSQAFDHVATLAGGRRVMESEIHTGGLESEPTMTMKENLLAKRYLDHRAETDGFRGGTHEVPIAQLNDWLREYRDQKGFSSRGDPYAPRTVAQPETRGQFKPTSELARLTDGRDIIDHLARVSDTARDPDSLGMMADRALRDKAITVDQYIRAQAAVAGAGYHTLQKLHVNLGSDEDQDSLVSRIKQFAKHTVLPQGTLPKPVHEALIKHEKYAQADTAYKIRNRMDALKDAVKKDYKTANITPKMAEDFTKVLRGDRSVARTMPVNVLNALADMRGHVDSNSLYIYLHDMASDTKQAVIESNVGKYLTRNYRMFDDPRYGYRPISTKNRAQAEIELNDFLKQEEFKKMNTDLIHERALAKAEDAASVFVPGSTEYNTAKRKAYDAEKARIRNNPATLWIDKNMAKWQQISENRQTKNMQYGHAFTVRDEILENLSPFLNASPALRKLMGEETNPLAMYARTVWRQSAFIHSVELGREIADMGRKAGYIRDQFTPATPTQIPSQFVHLGELAGKWTTKDIASALTNYVETLRDAEHGIMAKTVRALESNARYLTTIGSAQRGFGNIWSGVFTHLNNGYLNPFDREAWGAAVKVFQGNLLRMTTPELEDYMSDMHRYGLSDKTGNVGLIMDFLRSGPHIMEREPQDIGEEISQFLTKRVKQAPGVARFGEALVDFHTLGNFMSKASQWEKEQVRQRAIDDWWVRNRGRAALSEDQIKAKAAELVRDTNISYSLATKTIQQMRKNPTLGTFLTFWSEALRSYSNSVMQAFKHLRSENPVEQGIGRSRLGGLMVSLALPGALMGASKMMFNVSNKEDDNFRSLLPPWEKHNAIFYGPVINGRRTYTTINYLTPQGDVHRSINALLAPNQQGIVGKVRDATGEIFAPVFNVGLVPGALIDIYRNQTGYGTQIYNQEDHWQNQLGDMAQYMIHREFGGSGGRLFSKIVPALTTPGGKVTPGGAVYDLTSALLPEMSGLQVKEISYPDRFRSELYSSKNSIEHAQSLFTAPIQRSGNEMTDDQIRNAYQRSEDARRNAFENLHQQIQAARFGGMTSREIKSALKARRYSDTVIDDLMTGRYRPYVPSSGILKNARANGNHISPRLFGRHTTPIEEEEE